MGVGVVYVSSWLLDSGRGGRFSGHVLHTCKALVVVVVKGRLASEGTDFSCEVRFGWWVCVEPGAWEPEGGRTCERTCLGLFSCILAWVFVITHVGTRPTYHRYICSME